MEKCILKKIFIITFAVICAKCLNALAMQQVVHPQIIVNVQPGSVPDPEKNIQLSGVGRKPSGKRKSWLQTVIMPVTVPTGMTKEFVSRLLYGAPFPVTFLIQYQPAPDKESEQGSLYRVVIEFNGRKPEIDKFGSSYITGESKESRKELINLFYDENKLTFTIFSDKVKWQSYQNKITEVYREQNASKAVQVGVALDALGDRLGELLNGVRGLNAKDIIIGRPEPLNLDFANIYYAIADFADLVGVYMPRVGRWGTRLVQKNPGKSLAVLGLVGAAALMYKYRNQFPSTGLGDVFGEISGKCSRGIESIKSNWAFGS